jgi:Uma2 family endonuclease
LNEERRVATRPERKLTYEDYVNFPDDGRRWELIEGEAFMVPSPTSGHQAILIRLLRAIADHLDEHGGGEVLIAPLDVLLGPGDVVQPDVLFVSDDDAGVVKAKNVQGTPTWLLEVVSDPVRDRRVKRDLYMRYGVSEYWIVDPYLRLVEIHRPGEAVLIFEPPQQPVPRALPGLSIDLDALFGPPSERFR